MLAQILTAFICYFLPPAGWQAARLDDPTSPIELAFIGPPLSPAQLPPNISLSFEEVDCSLKDYVQGAKENILAEPGVTWRDLGKFKTVAGEARLTESSGHSNWGEIKTLQVLFVYEKKACILTATSLKKDFASLQSDLLNSLKSLTVAEDIWTAAQNNPNRQELNQRVQSVQEVKDLENLGKWLEKNFAANGPYWHFLVLKEAGKKIMNDKNLSIR